MTVPVFGRSTGAHEDRLPRHKSPDHVKYPGVKGGSDFARLQGAIDDQVTPQNRRRNARKILGEYFYFDMMTHWRENGTDALERVFKEDPSTYLKCMISVLPKQLEVNVNHFDGLSTEDLRDQLTKLTDTIKAFDDKTIDVPPVDTVAQDRLDAAEQARTDKKKRVRANDKDIKEHRKRNKKDVLPEKPWQ